MNTNPKCRVIKEYIDNGKHYAKGFIFEPWGTRRDVLLARGLIEIVKAEDVSESVAAVSEVPLPRRSKAKVKV